jgi:2Fe-2S ferredoxin
MPKISFVKNIAPIEVAAGTPLMTALLQHGRPVASSCHGDGVCAKCRVIVIDNPEGLTEPTAIEKHLRERFLLPSGVRISCQAIVRDDVCVDTTYW